MDLTSIELAGSVIASVTSQNDEVVIRFEPAYLIKSMTGSDERTKWKQNVELVFTGATVEDSDQLAFPATCAGGDVGENIYTYRDMIPVPLESRGSAHCDLGLIDTEQHIRVQAGGLKLVQEGTAKYIEHIR
jgi:hypothetical protein